MTAHLLLAWAFVGIAHFPLDRAEWVERAKDNLRANGLLPECPGCAHRMRWYRRLGWLLIFTVEVALDALAGPLVWLADYYLRHRKAS